MLTRSSSAAQSHTSTHQTSLDGLRFFAFLGVFLFHAFQAVPRFGHWFLIGAQGVQVFFVLSGFLIGRILLRERRSGAPLREKLRVFYVRRALRIFPLYYFVLFLIAAAPLIGFYYFGSRLLLPWYSVYLANLKIYWVQYWPGQQSHLWSLSVEEQFYVIAPLFLLTVPGRILERFFPLLWLACGGARVWCTAHGNAFFSVLMPFQLDSLTVGIAAAVLQQQGTYLGVGRETLRRGGVLCFGMFLLLAVIGIAWPSFYPVLHLFGGQWLLSVATAALIVTLWEDRGGRIASLLSAPVFVSLGRISYGLYLYHNFCLAVSDSLLRHRFVPVALLGFALTVLASALSWQALEKPINAFKRYFPYPI